MPQMCPSAITYGSYKLDVNDDFEFSELLENDLSYVSVTSSVFDKDEYVRARDEKGIA